MNVVVLKSNTLSQTLFESKLWPMIRLFLGSLIDILWRNMRCTISSGRHVLI